jgi:hypothetical protein
MARDYKYIIDEVVEISFYEYDKGTDISHYEGKKEDLFLGYVCEMISPIGANISYYTIPFSEERQLAFSYKGGFAFNIKIEEKEDPVPDDSVFNLLK